MYLQAAIATLPVASATVKLFVSIVKPPFNAVARVVVKVSSPARADVCGCYA